MAAVALPGLLYGATLQWRQPAYTDIRQKMLLFSIIYSNSGTLQTSGTGYSVLGILKWCHPCKQFWNRSNLNIKG